LSVAAYVAGPHAVVLALAKPIARRDVYQLFASGSRITGANGLRLDGNGDGMPGGDFSRTFVG
jgi:hypothetical protein